jgi:hypothetical protein
MHGHGKGFTPHVFDFCGDLFQVLQFTTANDDIGSCIGQR